MGAMTPTGKELMFRWVFRGETMPTHFYVMLITSIPNYTTPPVHVSDVTEIATGNGYTSGGIELDRDDVDFDTVDVEDGVDILVYIRTLDLVASGGSIPSSGYIFGAILTTDEATISERHVIAQMDRGYGGLYISNGDTGRLFGLCVGG
jgi:hypothetical protein